MMKKKRKIKITHFILLFIIFIIFVSSLIFLFFKLFNESDDKKEFSISDLNINELDYSAAKKFDFDLYSSNYLLIRLNDFKVLYENKADEKIYPASLTKVLTLDSVVNNVEDLNDTSYYTDDDYYSLIDQNASLAGLNTFKEYTLNELLYALILPSGADAASCLSNYFVSHDLNLVDLMNKRCSDLNLYNSHFTNTTGLHDLSLYTTLNDYAKIVIDTLLNNNSKDVLKTNKYNLYGNDLISTLYDLTFNEKVKVYGGKTGYTPEAGMNIMCLFSHNNRSYLLILSGAIGSPYTDGMHHIDDVNTIFSNLYNN